jgi:hypothetical protein
MKGLSRQNLIYLKHSLDAAQSAHECLGEEELEIQMHQLLHKKGSTSQEEWPARAICETLLSMTKSILSYDEYAEALVYSIQSSHWAQSCIQILKLVLLRSSESLK